MGSAKEENRLTPGIDLAVAVAVVLIGTGMGIQFEEIHYLLMEFEVLLWMGGFFYQLTN